jgi:signal peptidase
MSPAEGPTARSPIRWLRRLADLALFIVIGIGLGAVLLGRVLPATGHPVFVVAGPSMAPSIGVGSAVILETVDPSALQVGDVVSLRSGPDRAVFTHRITRIAERDGAVWIETKGDANAAPDPSITPATAVIGRVATVAPGAGYVLALLSTPVGVALVLSVGATLMVLGWLLDDIEAERRRARAGDPGASPASSEPTPTPAAVLAAATDDPATVPPHSTKPSGSSARRRRAPRRASDDLAAEGRRLARARTAGRGA